MKKLMIFAAAMCCMVSASAQQIKHELNVHKSLKDKVQQAMMAAMSCRSL